MTAVRERLFALADGEYRDFMARLLPTVDRARILGVRMPRLRALSGQLPEAEAAVFMRTLPHAYFEEDALHACLIARIRDFDRCLEETERFLPYVDNWAVCDSLRPKVFCGRRTVLLPAIEAWLEAENAYTVRFGVEMLMLHFLDGDFSPRFPAHVAALCTEEYYVHMMVAWYFATALAKQWEAALPYLEQGKLDRRTHNKAIQKAVESYRISEERKLYLKSLRRKT